MVSPAITMTGFVVIARPLRPRQSKTHFLAGFNYDDNGNRDRLTYYRSGQTAGPNTTVNYTYNCDNMLTGFAAAAAPAFKLENVTIDGLGRLTDANETLTKPDSSTIAHTLDFEYDSLSQLTDANITNIGGSTWSADFTYEDNGNMTSRDQTSFTYTGNEMLTAGGANLTYDKNGNQTTSLKDATTSMTLAYNWDNKLRSASIGTDSISLKYDPSGNRVQKNSTVNGNRKYIVDIDGDLPVILLEIDPADMSVKKGYIYANSQILAQNDSTGKYFYLHDRLGSVRQVITSSGAVVKLLTYNPFGETIEDYGDFYTPWQFTGQYLDSETGQYYLRARQYSPYLARFTGRDLVMGDFNEPLTLHRYLYCGNDPVNWIDPSGLDKYIGFEGEHVFVGVDVWEGGKKIGRMRYDFRPGAKSYLGLFLNIFFTDAGDVSKRDFSYDETYGIFNGGVDLKHKILKMEQSQTADKNMLEKLNELYENPPDYGYFQYNCANFSLFNFAYDYDDSLKSKIWDFIFELDYYWYGPDMGLIP